MYEKLYKTISCCSNYANIFKSSIVYPIKVNKKLFIKLNTRVRR